MALVIPPAGMRPMGAFDGVRRYQLPRPPVIRADQIDPITQEFTSLLLDRDPVDDAVIQALWRVRASGAAVVDVGARFLDIEKIDDYIETRLEAMARNALERLVKRGDITILSIVVAKDEGGAWAELTVRYCNNRAPRNREKTITVRVPEDVRP